VTGVEESTLESMLSSLVHKEVLGVTTDPMSPERGQYGFLQDLVKKVAYDMMSRRERKSGHLAAAAHLLGAVDEDEIVEVVAAHYLDAFEAEPNADDASEIREKARDMLIRAAERAASLGANAEAQRSLEHAIELTDGRLEQAGLLERAGRMARAGGRAEEATSIYERSISLFESQGATHPAARVSARLAEIMWDRGRLGEGVRRMEEAFAVLSQEEPDGDLATVAATLARLLFFSGKMEDSAARVEVALEIAEAQGLPEVLSQALNTKSLTLLARGRQREALALLRYALDVALDHEIPTAALRAYYNLTDASIQVDAYREARERVVAGLALARRVGHRDWEWQFIGQMFPQAALGEWDDVLQRGADLPFEAIGDNRIAYNGFLATIPSIHVRRGQLSEATQAHAVFSDADDSDDVQERSTAASGRAIIARAEGRHDDALRHAREALDARVELGIGHEAMKDSVVEGVEAALALGRFDEAEELLGIVASIPPGRQSPYLDAQSRRLNAKVADLRGDEAQVEAGFKRAAGMLRELETPFWMAVTLLEHGEWLVRQERAEDAKPLLDEAREVFERLEAAPWLERVDAVPVGMTAIG
jgi:tetratricopeptide (TPR) repeat protein